MLEQLEPKQRKQWVKEMGHNLQNTEAAVDC